VLSAALLHPREFWSRAICGEKPVAPLDPAFSEPGTYLVRLDASGDRPFELLKAVREVTNYSFKEAKALVHSTPSVVATSLSHRSVERVSDRIVAAGATVTLRG
jgi:ribosomal protein L7/L12